MTMKTIIEPVSTDKLVEELSENKFFRKTNNGGNEIYIITAHNSPNIMREIGRLREISFRDSGGGTGLDCDIDEFDTREKNFFNQLIVWNPTDKTIIGGYRFLLCDRMKPKVGQKVDTPTSELFDYSDQFIEDFLPYTIELGRSFVRPDYQPSKNLAKGIYSLDNLWDGLASLSDLYPKAKYFFGKVTMYAQLDRGVRDRILYFMNMYFPDKDKLVYPKPGLDSPIQTPSAEIESMFMSDNYREDFKTLVKYAREHSTAVPPLVNAYMSLSPSMRTFGTARNAPFGGVEETGILVTIADLYDEKLERHLTYDKTERPEHLK